MMPAAKYPLFTRWVHRVVALLVIVLIVLGWYVSGLDYESANYQYLRQLHRTLGLLLLPAGLAHLYAYTCLPRPPLAATLRRHEVLLARLAHMFLLYVALAIPVAGYLMSGENLVIVGGYKVPALVVLTKSVRSTLFDVHEKLAWITAAVVVVHVAAALKHHFIDKDDTLLKMK